MIADIVAGKGTEQAESLFFFCWEDRRVQLGWMWPTSIYSGLFKRAWPSSVYLRFAPGGRSTRRILVPNRQGTARCSPAAALKEVGVRPRKTMILQAVKGRWGVVQARKIIMREGCPPQLSLLRQQGTPMTLPSDPDFKIITQTFLLE